ncbi:MAG: tetratricopeptide repeat protein [Deltaproteobacteria bacterium]|nr:tetratricopeptide repeat protein [Deltaproteobacteria bacterium]MBI3293786.1 tetratricopeptide repeat protein [Deltaproteobacteria bacterium]
MDDLKRELIELLGHGEMLRAALLVGGIRDSAFNADPYLKGFETLAKGLTGGKKQRRTGPTMLVARINSALFKKFGMAGGSGRPRLVIDDPERFFIDRVIDKRSGSPLALAILYWALAERGGLKCECLALPSYYLLKFTEKGKDCFIDPFEGGRILSSEEFQRKFRSAFVRPGVVSTSIFERITPMQIVARLIQQLKQIYVLKGNSLCALRAVELLVGLFPDSPEFARDRGILYCEMEYFSKAAEDLNYYLLKRARADDVVEIKRLSRMLKGYREVVN